MDVAPLPQVINKTDLAEAVGADLKVMERDSIRMRDGGPFVFAQVPYGYPHFFEVGLYIL
jgi:Ni2+-binding GTPase involved in maturation of urease and hydrogenase